MGRRCHTDPVDQVCRCWADQRRVIIGLVTPTFGHEYIGALTCTLAKIKQLHNGASASGMCAQHYPEIYTHEAQAVNRAYHAMDPALREILDAHYVFQGSVSMKADVLSISLGVYFERLRQARSFIDGFLAHEN